MDFYLNKKREYFDFLLKLNAAAEFQSYGQYCIVRKTRQTQLLNKVKYNSFSDFFSHTSIFLKWLFIRDFVVLSVPQKFSDVIRKTICTTLFPCTDAQLFNTIKHKYSDDPSLNKHIQAIQKVSFLGRMIVNIFFFISRSQCIQDIKVYAITEKISTCVFWLVGDNI